MLRYLRYTVIALSVVFLLATSVTAAVSPARPLITINMQTDDPIAPQPEPIAVEESSVEDAAPAQVAPESSDSGESTASRRAAVPGTQGPVVSESIPPSVSAPVSSLPVADPPDPNQPPREINPRQNPTRE